MIFAPRKEGEHSNRLEQSLREWMVIEQLAIVACVIYDV